MRKERAEEIQVSKNKRRKVEKVLQTTAPSSPGFGGRG